MAIKLKNGNKARITGFLITVFAAALFTALFPAFQKHAANRATNYSSYYGWPEQEEEEFLNVLIRSNYALYKNVMDKGIDKVYTYKELYISEDLSEIKETDTYSQELEDFLEAEGDYSWKYGEGVSSEEILGILQAYADKIQTNAAACENTLEQLGTQIDYYVLDKSSKTSIKNTSLPIEGLLHPSDEEFADLWQAADEAYDYYVIMDYNESGYLQNVSVRGVDADRLLKTVKTLEGSRQGRLLTELEEVESFLVYDENTRTPTRLLTMTQKKPTNATFIYALTSAQLQWNVPIIYGYYGIVDNMYLLFLTGILAVTLLLAFCRPALLCGKRERRLPLEVVLAAAFVIWIFGIETLPELVMEVMEGNLREWLDSLSFLQPKWWMDAISVQDMIGFGISFCVAVGFFGLFCFCCIELSDMIRDRKDYFRTRCLVWRFLRKIKTVIGKTYQNLKTEIHEADLNKDLSRLLRHLLFINFCIMVTCCLLWMFGAFVLAVYSLVLYFLCRKYLHRIQIQYGKLLEASNSIAQGRLDNSFEEDFGIFSSYKEELYNIQDGFKKAVDEEVKSQKMKTELITNVSHDLKTPLTAIITYIDLLKEDHITEEERKEYLDTLERKSIRLKVLIEDLFEVSKANSGNVQLEKVPVDIANLLRQVYLEHEEKMKQADLQVRFVMPEEKIILYLDSQKTYRIFENLYTNIIKYALPATRVFVTMEKSEDGKDVCIELKNISAQEIIGNPQDLTERFVRGDVSRNTEGNGLGLAIARSFTELQGGSFRIETDGDLFKVRIEWSILNLR